MQKSIPVYLDETPWFAITVTKGQTIGDLKKVFGYNRDLRLQMLVNNQDYPVMATSQYNKESIDPVWNDQIQIVATRKHIQRVWSRDPNTDKLILMNFSPSDLFNVCLTNNYVANLCRDKNFWRNKIARDFPLRGKFIYYDQYRSLYQNDPQQLYSIINQKSKIVTLEEDDYIDLANKIPEDDDLSDVDTNLITEAISMKLDKLPLLRGDVIFLEWMGEDRNIGKILWDGEQVVTLNTDIDDYGAVDPEFTFPEFPLNHFFHSIDHNNIIWLSDQTLQELRQNYREEIPDPGNREMMRNMGLSGLYASSVITDNFGTKYRVRFFFDGKAKDFDPKTFKEEIFWRGYLDIDDANIENVQEDGITKQFDVGIYVSRTT